MVSKMAAKTLNDHNSINSKLLIVVSISTFGAEGQRKCYDHKIDVGLLCVNVLEIEVAFSIYLIESNCITNSHLSLFQIEFNNECKHSESSFLFNLQRGD